MKKARWVIQNNLIKENDYKELQNACKNIDTEFQEVQVIPFSEELPEFVIDDKINIYYGSTTFMYNLYHKLNKPVGLFFDEDTFSMENYLNKWGKHMLNSEAKITNFDDFSKELHDDESLWFIRPDADDKSFSGTVMSFKEIKDWTKTFQSFDNVQVHGQTKIIVGEPYNIKKEWRNYVVDGKVVTSSLYRKDFKLNKSRKDIPEDMIRFVEERCKEYMPHKIIAMDIALCGDEYYIIECGCLNSVGLYDCDINALVKGVTEYIIK